LITGGSGFIGTNVIEAFQRHGSSILNIDISPPRNPAHVPFWSRCDVMDMGTLRRNFASFQPDAVMHLAARTDLDERRDSDSYAVNTGGVANVIDAITQTGSVERSFFASSRLVFDLDHIPTDDRDYHASTLYGQSKARGEELVRNAPPGLGTWTILRPTGIWGPWFGVPYRDFFNSIEHGWYANPGKRGVRKAYGYVGNTVYQLQRLASTPPAAIHQKTFWIADYPPVLVADWARLIQEESGARPIRTVPVPVLRVAALIGDAVERLGLRRAPLTTFRLNNMLTDMVYPTDQLEDLVGPLPYTLEEGVKRTIAWLHKSSDPS
jgi:nucleoside-diphosphate-sugar epimerase